MFAVVSSDRHHSHSSSAQLSSFTVVIYSHSHPESSCLHSHSSQSRHQSIVIIHTRHHSKSSPFTHSVLIIQSRHYSIVIVHSRHHSRDRSKSSSIVLHSRHTQSKFHSIILVIAIHIRHHSRSSSIVLISIRIRHSHSELHHSLSFTIGFTQNQTVTINQIIVVTLRINTVSRLIVIKSHCVQGELVVIISAIVT